MLPALHVIMDCRVKPGNEEGARLSSLDFNPL
jgi:hypothetical protein